MKGKPETAEECARRMERFLAKPPRKAKTKEYLKTLKGDRKKIRAEQFEMAKEAAIEVLRKCGNDVNIEPQPPVRRDRIRNKAKLSKWNCRSANRMREWKRDNAGYRSLEGCTQQRFILYAAQNGICGLCGETMLPSHQQHSLDHVVPRSLGGPDAFGNLILTHKECNGAKSNDIPTGCEAVFLLAVNAKLDVNPKVF